MQNFWVPFCWVTIVLGINYKSPCFLWHFPVITAYLMFTRMKVLFQAHHQHPGICSTLYTCGELNYCNKESTANKADRRHLFPMMCQQIINCGGEWERASWQEKKLSITISANEWRMKHGTERLIESSKGLSKAFYFIIK